MLLSVISFTEKGMNLSLKIAEPDSDIQFGLYTKCKACKSGETDSTVIYVNEPVGEWAKERMSAKSAILFIGACGIAVRAVSPHITDKMHDVPVLVADECGEHIIPILAGHMGGANALAEKIARRTGGTAVITTATDINGKFAVDLFAQKNNLYIEDKDGIVKVSSKVLAGEEITMSIAPELESMIKGKGVAGEDLIRQVAYPPDGFVDIIVTSEEHVFDASLCLKPKEYVIGIGCKKGKSAAEIDSFINENISRLGISVSQIIALSSISLKSGEQGIAEWCRRERIPFVTYTADELREVEGDFTASEFVRDRVGVDNVCERAALAGCGVSGELIASKYAENGMTIAVAKKRFRISDAPKRIYIVGIGPGRENMMTQEALEVLEDADVIVGYTLYLELLGERFRDKEMLSTPMRREEERCRLCFGEAQKGKKTALVCSGDAGIYGLASLMYEIGKDYPDIELIVVAGVTAASSGAAVLGAPLNHDFCVISLSDILTPWEKIERRLRAAADGDFVVVLYNPSSRRRTEHLKRACDILLCGIEGERVCGYVENIGRDGTKAHICTLEELRNRELNMFTTVFIGNSKTEVLNGKMITGRGYKV